MNTSTKTSSVVGEELSAQPITFDADGDLFFITGPSKQRFRVCSRAVSRVSPVFQKMLNGPWIESKRPSTTTAQEDWTVELPEDDEFGLALVFYIAHSLFDQVSSALSVAELFKVCVIAHKYDVVGILRPWATPWTENVEIAADQKLLWVAWILGHEALFTKTAADIVFNTTVVPSLATSETENTLVTSCSMNEEEVEYFESIGITDDILKARQDMVDTLLGPLESVWAQLQSSDIPAKVTCRKILYSDRYAMSNEEVLECRCFLLGSFIRATQARNLFPLPNSSTYTNSVSQLIESVSSMSFEKMTKLDDRRDRHQECDLNEILPQHAEEVFVDFEPGPEFIDHLRKQRLKTGLSD